MITLYDNTKRLVICSRTLKLDDDVVFIRGKKYEMEFDGDCVTLIDECNDKFIFSSLQNGSNGNYYFHVDQFFRELNPKKEQLLSIYEM